MITFVFQRIPLQPTTIQKIQATSDDEIEFDSEHDEEDHAKYVQFDLRNNHFIHSLDRRHLKLKSSSSGTDFLRLQIIHLK